MGCGRSLGYRGFWGGRLATEPMGRETCHGTSRGTELSPGRDRWPSLTSR